MTANLDQLKGLLESIIPAAQHPPSDISGKVGVAESEPSLEETVPATVCEVVETFQKWLVMPDPGPLLFVLSIYAGHSLDGDPLWGIIVAPPSGTKTEIIRALEGVPRVYSLSELTARTFASGLEGGKRDPSLLPRLSDHVLALKDFTSVLTMHREERQAVLAQLREIYDGRFDKAWGTGKELHWRGRLGFIAGCTPIIDLHHSVHQVLGERFLLFRAEQPNRRHMALRAMRGRGHESEMRRELRGVVARLLTGLDPTRALALPDEYEEGIAALADFVSTARSGVVRDGYSREMTLAPEPEAPARLAKQLASLTVGHAMIGNDFRQSYAFAQRVATDCLTTIRARVIDVLAPTQDYVSTPKAAEGIGYPTQTTRRVLEDLTALGVVSVRKEGQGRADNWRLSDWSRETLSRTALSAASPASEGGTVPEKSTGCSGHLVQAGPHLGASVAEP